ncbi:MAG: hypothetical protein IKZ87_08375 [Actinomycetaceae bacterium]|nr:hypothetical protein [Actinomycetaceae bacterium]
MVSTNAYRGVLSQIVVALQHHPEIVVDSEEYFELNELSVAIRNKDDERTQTILSSFNAVGEEKSSFYKKIMTEIRLNYFAKDFEGLLDVWLRTTHYWHINRKPLAPIQLRHYENRRTDGKSNGEYYIGIVLTLIMLMLGDKYANILLLSGLAISYAIARTIARYRFTTRGFVLRALALVVTIVVGVFTYKLDFIVKLDAATTMDHYPSILIGVLVGLWLGVVSDSQRVYRERIAFINKLPLFSSLTRVFSDGAGKYSYCLRDDQGNIIDSWEEKAFFDGKIDYVLGAVAKELPRGKECIVYPRLVVGRKNSNGKVLGHYANLYPYTWEEVKQVVPGATLEAAIAYFSSQPSMLEPPGYDEFVASQGIEK